MISKIFSKARGLSLINRSRFRIVTHKLSYGQGGYCDFNLLKRNYQIQFQTIWQDHCLIEVEGAQGKNSLSILQEGNKTIIHDQWVEENQKEKVSIKFKLPEDYTYFGKINGSISHVKSNVSNKLRCNQTNIILLGKNRVFQWGSLQTPSINIQAINGAIDIKSLTFQNAKFNCHSFSSSKVLFSGSFNLKANYLVNIRSVVTFGKATAHIESKYVQIQSISGAFCIQGQKVKINRIWGSPQGITIKSKKVEKIGIQTGTGVIESEQPIPDGAITLGKLHKGNIKRVSENKIRIE